MRDPFSWSFPIGRLFGISVRVHFLFPLVCLGLILRTTTKDFYPGTWIDMSMVLGLLFVTVTLHEFGHCFATRRVGGEASEILLWPLGGLAACDVPHNPRAHFVTAAGGPGVNVLICLVAMLAMATVLEPSFRPVLNPFWNPLRENAAGQIALYRWNGSEQLTDNVAALVLARLFWVSWVTFLLNILLVGFPFDAGRMFQSALWPYLGYRQATLYAVFAGFICMFLLLVASIIWNEVLVLFLAFFTYTACKQEWITLESGGEESLFGYDFSQGYTSLERDEPPPQRQRRKKLNFFQRWLQGRATRKQQKQRESAEAEARRVDELLEKIQLHGKDSLTDEENRFLKRYADRMKNK
ncbi:MAG TPA: site-2 protease family protein [Gemmataceae bacterium]|jgi:Zn-dependent protease|nr:site-2 protease family protein [Gemmataceae bacterium]